MARSLSTWVPAALAVVLFVGCNVLPEEAKSPTEPEPVATVSAITIPVIVPASNPTPVPPPANPGTPAPTPETPTPGTPTPTPTPEPPPSSGGGCTAGPSNPSNPTCRMDPPDFLGQFETAITRTTNKHPELFDFNDRKCPDCYFVKNIDRYVDYVLNELHNQGLCTYWDGEEIAVKRNNNRSEQYDPILASGHIRRGDGSYRGNCSPSWF